MKTKFHLAKRVSPRYTTNASAQGAAQAVALVDERYLLWLASQQEPKLAAEPMRSALVSVFAGLARLSGSEVTLARAYLFTDCAPTGLFDDLVLRVVPQHDVDGGLGLVRSLGLELTQLAARGACQVALVASDDERLIPYIDEAQWRGLKVVLVADESLLDMGKLMGDDPSWARLLMQADRRVSLNPSAWQALVSPGTGAFHAGVCDFEPAADVAAGSEVAYDAQPSDEWRTQVQKVIEEWWQDETHHARVDLYEEMQNSQGVPPETDRHLLLRVRRVLARTLSFPEKKTMREMIRATVMAQPPVADEALGS